MKIGEMNTKQLAKCLVTIAEPISAIAKDQKVLEQLQKLSAPKKGQPAIVFYADMISGFIPLLLGEHERDVYTIIAAMTDQTIEQVEAQPGMTTYAQIRDFLDADFMSFFNSAAPTSPAK